MDDGPNIKSTKATGGMRVSCSNFEGGWFPTTGEGGEGPANSKPMPLFHSDVQGLRTWLRVADSRSVRVAVLIPRTSPIVWINPALDRPDAAYKRRNIAFAL